MKDSNLFDFLCAVENRVNPSKQESKEEHSNSTLTFKLMPVLTGRCAKKTSHLQRSNHFAFGRLRIVAIQVFIIVLFLIFNVSHRQISRFCSKA